MNSVESYPLIVVLGPTASGKTTLAAYIAAHCRGEVISADSRQVYLGMDLGTGKDYEDYIVNGKEIPVHLIDISPAGSRYNVFEYQKDFLKAYHEILLRGNLPILCGGSGLYIEAVVCSYRLLQVPVNVELRSNMEQKSMDELIQILSSLRKLHNKTDTVDRKRLIRAIEIETFQNENLIQEEQFQDMQILIYGVKFDLDTRRTRITERLKARLNRGMVEEVRQLMAKGLSANQLTYYGLEYKFLTRYLIGEINYEEMILKLNIAIQQLAKRQMTWFRKMEREGIQIKWLDGRLPLDEKLNVVLTDMRRINDFHKFLT